MRFWAFWVVVLAVVNAHPPVAWAIEAGNPPGLITVMSRRDFTALVTRLEAVIKDNGMELVARMSASAAASGQGVAIPGDAVLMVSRNDLAVRVLRAHPIAGIEIPIPIHAFERAGRRSALGYRRPSTLLAPYGSKVLNEIGQELDVIVDRIVAGAAGE